MKTTSFVKRVLSQKTMRQYTAVVNNEILKLTQLQHIPLGPAYSSMTGEAVREHLTIHRMVKKFEHPDDKNASKRKLKSIQDVITHDANGLPSHGVYNPHVSVCVPEVKKVLYKARVNLQRMLNEHFYLSYEDDVQFPSGETLISLHGEVDLQNKLADVSQWCITGDAFNLFIKIAQKHRAIKKMVKEHWSANVRYAYGPTQPGTLRKAERGLWNKYQNPQEVFRNKVRAIVTFVYGARFTTVPKNNEVDRVIECEAMLNMICQRVIAGGIRRVLRAYGVILPVGQDVHKALIQKQVDTTDLKNASNSIWMQVVRWFLGNTYLGRLVEKTRSAVVLVEGELVPLNMVAPMGNGFTFELMTLLLLSICREIDDKATVYGDDIITHHSANLVHASLQAIGVQLNVEKTFVQSKFRESCGGFYHDDIGYITCFEFTWAEDFYDAIVLTNKLKLILDNLRENESIVREAYQRILDAAPSFCLVPGSPSRDTLDVGVFTSKAHIRRVQRKSSVELTHEMCEARRQIISQWHLNKSFVYFKVNVEKTAILRRRGPVHLHEWSWTLFYLYNGRRSDPEIRDTYVRRTLTLCADTHQVLFTF